MAVQRFGRRMAAIWLGISLCGAARGEVTGYTVARKGRDTVLTSVTVERGDRAVVFKPEKLIRARVTHFQSSDGANVITPAGAGVPIPTERAWLLSDGKLNSGLINPGGQAKPLATSPVLAGPEATPGFAVAFEQPVINLPGDDVVFFEFQRKEASPLGGDAFHVGPLEVEANLRAVTVEAFDIPWDDPRAMPIGAFDFYRADAPPQSFADLRNARLSLIGTPNDFKALAVGIDLSDLGYAEDAAVSGLFFQDCDGKGLLVDPVLVAGLPAPDAENRLAEAPASTGPKPGELLDAFLEGPMAGVDEIIFAVRIRGFDHWYANFGYYSASVPEYPPQQGIEGEDIPPLFGDGARLCRYHLRTKDLKVLLDDPKGSLRDPQVHYDGTTILFSYRRGGQPYFHLYEIRADGTGLVQLTDGPYDDIEPTYLPDGGIMFCSSRCNRFVNCYRTPVATLYRCDGDGRNIRMISTNIEHDNTPWVLDDGRIIYMRWEYVDRSQFCFHHLWSTNPDGTGQMVFFGNQFPDTAMLDAKPIPGTNKVVASFSPGHGRTGHMGRIVVIDPKTGPDHRAAALQISAGNEFYRDPYAFSEECFLVADDRGIHVMNGFGDTELVYRLPEGEAPRTCNEPRPLVPRRRERVIPPRVNLARETGRLALADIYKGRNMDGVERGEIKKLLVLEQLPKPISFSGGMWPISAGGTFTLSRVLGTVPVEPDGSAFMELPAMRSLFFVALDENDLSVKRMQSFVSLEPGEVTGCVGCHEQRATTPLAALAETAGILGRTPSRIEPIADVPEVLDFPRDVQPILDKHCVECHNPDRMEGRVDLSGDHTPLFSQSFWTIMHRGLIADGRNEDYGNRPPRTIGSSASRLMQLIDGSHYDAELSELERKTVRLWIETSAVYAGTYAALGSGMHPVKFPVEVMEKRCGACHGSDPPPRPIGTGRYFRFGDAGPYLPLVHEFTELQQIRGSIGYYKFGNARPPQSLCNLTRPDKSILLRAPLAREAGGLGLCRPTVFAGVDDPDYRAIRANIVASSEKHREEKRFDMPGFRPNVYYVRIMQRYGILPAELDLDDPIDVYATDQAYWDSFLYSAD